MIGYDTIEYASLTDVGVRRSHNQDAHATLLASDDQQWQERGHVFLVADGMGAHAVGELASELAVSIIPHTYHKHALQGGVPALRRAFVEANASIHAKGQQNPEFGGMGTTATGLLLRPEGAWVGHVGDSRAYRIRDGQIEQLSSDHSLVWEMARRGGVDPEELEGIPHNVIIRSLGPEPLVQVDVEGPHALQVGDTFLLCSDGLSGQLSDPEIGAIASALPPAEACRFLIDLANLRGGPDNITVVVVRVHEKAAPPNDESAGQHAWYRRIPWPAPTLLAGLALVAAAMALKVYDLPKLSMWAFLVAAVAIVGGLGGLAVYFSQEKRRLANEQPAGRPRIYRQASCQVDLPLIDKLAKAVASLERQVKERQWEVDWKAFEQAHALAESHLGKESLDDSFREYCRALRLLAETFHRQRNKGEVFQPIWDKG